jgi:formylglycine-generating enzyme required for sulfatase activity/predicted Ser/Thr protein kinase
MATEYVKTIECPKCRYKNVAGTKFCGDCGTALAGSPVPCGKCGFENPSGTKFCGNCGNNIENPTENDPDIRHLQDALRGKYVVQKALGEGGFGRVFLAEHIGLKQKHVIKVLSADSSRSIDIRNRFFQEAQVIAKLKHPHIVPIMDVAEHGGRPYYIMSYINGGSLADLLRLEKKLSTERAIELTIKLLSALSEVHGKGIIHRDIKPDNVLLDESGEPYLIDFGIARVEEGGEVKSVYGISIGTPQYMSPEQLDAKPDAKPISLTTDIYSMGIMLFELLTGKPPYEGSLISIANQHNTAKLPNVSGKIENSKLADSIQAVLQKACAKEPSARYSSAKEMRGAVEGLIQAKSKPNPEWEKMEAEHKKRMEELRKKEEELQAREKVVVQERKIDTVNTTVITKQTPDSFTNSLGMEFVLIPAGEFMMGAVPQDNEAFDNEAFDNEKPQHKVRITKPFYMGKYPVTQEEWEKLMGNNPSSFSKAGKRAPVEQVSWNDCKEFINKLNQKEGKTYRLPTEAEWEYSARGGDSGGSTIYTYGDDVSKLGDYAWFDDNSGNTTHPVGQKKPNSLGLYDMMGNIWEWCGDRYHDEYYKNTPNADPKGADKGVNRVLRGGSWGGDAGYCRLSYRDFSNPDYRYFNFGFRLVLLP